MTNTAAGAVLGDAILFHNTMRVLDGHLAEFRAAIERAVAFAQGEGPQLMVEVFIDEPRMLAHSFQLYADSDAVRAHWRMSDPYIRGVMEHCEIHDFAVYGDPDPELRDALAEQGLPIVPRFTGFTRHPAGASPR
ncbi:hypothetical protein [Nocardiopsis composta]|uniref:Antibiotic biosynthesis monooxygenase n=1 Tax=Nocardiopsis composta TaxID=157465 RepID=A0A7W8VDG1_9ACTN|nr:hypothetical protein [Nocardiopsis composta]MBB5432010.1 hypothetical protein [Nocardiopsis composta]